MSIRTSRSSKRLIAAAVAVAVTASTFAISSTAGATGTEASPAADRIGGANRFATAGLVAAAINTATDKVTEVILVNGRNFPDGLAASALATNSALTTQRPILLTESGTLPTETADALKALKNLTKVWVIGETAAVSANVLGQIVDAVPGIEIARIGGADRYATSIKIAEAVSTAATPAKALLVTGENFPDALAAGALAAANGWPILLNNGATLRSDVQTFLTGNRAVTEVIIVGGTTVVPAAVETALKALKNEAGAAIETFRHGGADRFETAVSLSASLSASPAGVILANGANFPDALAAGPLSANVAAPILLTQAGSIPAATAEWHITNANTLKDVWAVGGASVISAEVLDGAKAAASASAPVFTSAAVTATATASASVALIANQVTVSAVAGGAAAGALGNNWTVTVSTTAVAGLAPVITVSTSATPCSTCTDAVTGNAVIIGVPAGGVSVANLKTAWDASDAAAVIALTVGTGSGTTVIALGAGIGGALTGGATEVKITLGFSEAAVSKSATPFQVFTNSLLNSEITGLAIPAPTASTDGKSLTFVVLEASASATEVAALTTGTAVVRTLTGGFARKGLTSVDVVGATQTLS